MCNQCQWKISDFRKRTTSSPWKLDRIHVADRLQEILNDPDSIQQGALGFCGPAAFLWEWVLRDHLAVVEFAIQLYDTGKSAINDYSIEPSSELLNCDYSSIQWLEDKFICPSTDWMIMSSLQDQQNGFLNFDGTPKDWTQGFYPWDVAKILEETNLYKSVKNETAAIQAIELFLKKGINHALNLNPNDYTDVILLINAQLIAPYLTDKGIMGFYNNNVSNHYIGLCSAPTISIVNGIEKIKMEYFTWGSKGESKSTLSDFHNNYYGAIIAEAHQAKTPLSFQIPSRPNVPYGLSAKLEGSAILISWMVSSLNDQYYIIQRKKKSGGNWQPIDNVPARRPSTIGSKYEDKVPSGTNDIYFYRIKAKNRNGESGFSNIIMVDLPSGDARVLDPNNIYISRPPSYLKQINIVRAPSGLQPIGYARFEDNSCECLQPEEVYNACWEYKSKYQRTLNIRQNIPFKPNRDAYIFVKFADYSLADGIPMQDDTVTLKLTGKKADGSSFDIPVKMLPGIEVNDRTYYWGSFKADNQWYKNYKINIEIHAKDAFDRYDQRNPSGHEIDASPSDEAYTDLANPPYYPFINYQPGIDRNHSFEIGTIIKDLPEDSFEVNNNFSSATKVLLAPKRNEISAWKSFDQISLNNATDIDYFMVEYQSSTADDNCELLEPTTEELSKLLGLYIVHYPPIFSISLQTNNKDCIDLALYKSDSLNTQLTHNLEKINKFVLYNPTKTHFQDKRFYTLVKNSDYDSQGAIKYSIIFSYSHAQDVMRINTNAPAYKPRTTVTRKLFQNIFDKLDLPRPGENLESRYQINIKTVVQKAINFISDQQTAADLQEILKRNIAFDLANDFRSTANVARSLNMNLEAEKLLLESYKQFSIP